MTKLRVGSDVEIETVLTDKKNKKRIKVPIETNEAMPVNMGQVIFEFDSSIIVSNTQCKNVVQNFVSKLK